MGDFFTILNIPPWHMNNEQPQQVISSDYLKEMVETRNECISLLETNSSCLYEEEHSML
jgi:hypothetical protein